MANRKRPIVLRCPVTAEERALIEQKMAQLPTQRIGAYLRKMAIDGYIIYTDTADIKAFTKELSAIDRNINQIAKRINAGGPAYQADMDEIRERLDEIWQLQRHILTASITLESSLAISSSSILMSGMSTRSFHLLNVDVDSKRLSTCPLLCTIMFRRFTISSKSSQVSAFKFFRISIPNAFL